MRGSAPRATTKGPPRRASMTGIASNGPAIMARPVQAPIDVKDRGLQNHTEDQGGGEKRVDRGDLAGADGLPDRIGNRIDRRPLVWAEPRQEVVLRDQHKAKQVGV